MKMNGFSTFHLVLSFLLGTFFGVTLMSILAMARHDRENRHPEDEE